MSSVAKDSWQTYRANLKLVVLFSIPFVISFAIPLFVPLPTYISGGAIFLRSASIFTNLNAASLAVMAASLFFSLLFISFAFVAISLIVKSTRTHTRIRASVFKGIERYTANVFLVLLIYAFFLLLANIIGYYTGYELELTSLVGFFGFMAIFYAPSAIVVDDRSIVRAVRNSMNLVAKAPGQFHIWRAVAHRQRIACNCPRERTGRSIYNSRHNRKGQDKQK